ncbi:glycosyltransferase family 4 protein [Polyangium aurulentum]|uniref:glycosyltransferase family 4 protein n=1 Tax=Polyangium aurulentum TaxID=2567896 RepID=UPI00146DE7E0|nr:glycosyltransferase family 1 protein [Polyangium aurulentum]UQA56712.1 glycosyltransferase family 4 protein [Polyangium aurulentum]
MDVLVDYTPLDCPMRFHGIGHYVRSLGRALAALSDRERQGLSITGIGTFGGASALEPPSSGASAAPRHGTVEWLARRRVELLPTLLRMRPRLFHMTQPKGTPRGAFVPRVVTCHDILPLVLHRDYLPGPWPYRGVMSLAEAARYWGARRIIAISQYTADDLMRLLHVPAKRIDVVPHGVDHDRFRPARSAEEEAAGSAVRARLGVDRAPYFLHVGAADPRKKVDQLIAAFAAAKLDGVTLVLAGRLGADHERAVNAALDRAGRPPSIRLLGYVADEDLVPLMRGALALVYPSIYEGFGLPVLEAMASGCPVITTRATSLGEVAGDAALMIPPADERALLDALRRIALEPGLRAQLTEMGLARAGLFSWRTTALGTVDCYARALAD